MKKTPLMIQVDLVDRNRIEMLSAKWGGISLSATVRKVLEEYVTHIDASTSSKVKPKLCPGLD